MWEALFKIAPPLIQAVSVAVTAVFAVIGLRAWRRQLLGRRKIEIAEGTLLAAYKIIGFDVRDRARHHLGQLVPV